MAKIKDLPKFKRPREKLFEKGSDALKDYELLAILLRTGYQGKSALEVARRILKTHKLEKLSKLSPEELAKIKGVGESRAATIAAAVAMSKRMKEDRVLSTINTPADAFKAVNFLRNKKKEYFVALYLDARNKLIKTQIISVGTLTANLVHPREVFAPAIKVNAAQLVVVHNHPSGSVKPSKDDIKITKKLVDSGKILGIEAIDHIILSKEGYISLKEEGLF